VVRFEDEPALNEDEEDEEDEEEEAQMRLVRDSQPRTNTCASSNGYVCTSRLFTEPTIFSF
jgi:hypothetical protein